jgi:hypothetical protein
MSLEFGRGKAEKTRKVRRNDAIFLYFRIPHSEFRLQEVLT